MAITAAVSDFGLTRVPGYHIANELASASLLPILEGFEAEPLPIHIVHAAHRHAPATVQQFADLAVERLRADRVIGGCG